MRQILPPDHFAWTAQESKIEPVLVNQLPKPAEIKNILDEYRDGQDAAKKHCPSAFTITTSVFFSKLDTSDVELEKSNVLLIGPTGCGKTLLARTLAKILKVPFAICERDDAYTSRLFSVEDVENIVLSFLQDASTISPKPRSVSFISTR